MRWSVLIVVVLIPTAVLATACSSSNDNGATNASDPQKPPTTGRADVQAWLGTAAYKAWHCEPSPHEARKPSPHGMNRICSNDVLAAHGDAEFPVDSAAVKELYDAAGSKIVGYAVYRHVKAGTSGDAWYWYETVPEGSAAPHDANGVVADGLGGAGPAKDICVSCHGAAGSDAAHFGHDFVYTQVK